ncbi:MAG: AbrB/MazE/SpoVT family DNA-binding domain-containing protein [Desulfuromonadaceae bacterium]
MPKSSLTSDNQIVIPADILKELGLKAGAPVTLNDRNLLF